MKRDGMKKGFMLVGIMLFAVLLLAACSSDTSNSGGTNTGGNSSANKGNDDGAPVDKEIHVLLSHANAEYAQQARQDDMYIQALSEQSGYDLNFEFLGHGNDYIQQLTVRFASQDLPDLIRTDSIDSTMHPGALDQNVFHELSDLIDEFGPNLKSQIPEAAWNSPKVSQDGKIYGIPTLAALPASRVIYIRQDWLDQLGMDTPETIEDFLSFFEAVKNNDVNGNGDPNDEYGFYVREDLIYSDMFFREFGAHPGQWYLRDGELMPGMILPEMKEAITFWKDLYDNGYINPNLFTNINNDWLAGIYQGKAGMWVHDVPNLLSSWDPGQFINQPDLALDTIKAPGGLSAEGDQISFVWVIPATVENPEEIIKFLDWAWSEEADDFFNFGIEDVNYTVENGEIQWDPEAEANAERGASLFYQLSVNPRGDGRMHPNVVSVHPKAEQLTKAIEVAEANNVPNDGLYIPALKALQTRPELAPGTGAGTLFLDVFAKIITGQEEMDAFDDFVAEWKRRGGDEVIQEATEWYHDFHG